MRHWLSGVSPFMKIYSLVYFIMERANATTTNLRSAGFSFPGVHPSLSPFKFQRPHLPYNPLLYGSTLIQIFWPDLLSLTHSYPLWTLENKLTLQVSIPLVYLLLYSNQRKHSYTRFHMGLSFFSSKTLLTL